MFTSRYEGGTEFADILQRITVLEKYGSATSTAFRQLQVTDNFELIYDVATQPNTMLFSEPNGKIVKRSLASLMVDIADQTHIIGYPDGTISVNLPQSIATSSVPTFSGMNLLGDIVTTGKVDGVDISVFYNNYTSHINNSTTAHFGQDLKATAMPQFNGLYITGSINVTGNVDGVDISDFYNNFNSHRLDTTIHFTEASIDHTHIRNIGLNSHAQIDSHISNSTTAHFGQDLKSTATPTFGQLNLASAPTTLSGVATKAYVDGLINGLIWQKEVKEYYDPTGGLPVSPTIGDRYLSYATANGWTIDYIYEWNGSSWIDTQPEQYYAVFIQAGTIHPTDLFVYNGILWCQFGSTMDHEVLFNIGTHTHPQIDTHINDTTIHFTVPSIDHTLIQNIGTNTHTQIDDHIANSTTAHFGQDLKATAHPTFAQISLTADPTDPEDVTTKEYVDNRVSSNTWQWIIISIFDPTGGLPLTPTIEDKYISYATANGWTINNIYVWNGTNWIETVPRIGYNVYVQSGDHYATYEMIFNGSIWTPYGTVIDHLNLKNTGTHTHAQIDTHIADTTIHFTEATINHQNIVGHGVYTHSAIDTHINNSTNAHFGQDLKTTATPTFTNVIVANQPTMSYHLANKGYVDAIAQGVIWQPSVKAMYDPTGGLPVSPTTGDRYISYETANGWTKDYIYQWNVSIWDETIPLNGFAVLIEGGTIHPNTMMMYRLNTGWIVFGTAIDHKSLLNIGVNTHDQIDTHIDDTTIHYTMASIDHTSIQNVGTNTHAQIDTHLADTTTAHFGQDLKNTASPTFANVNISNDPTSDTNAVRKSYFDTIKNKMIWQDSVISFYDPSGGLPADPAVGDRYLCSVSGNGWLQNHIYQWNGTTWTDIPQQIGFTLWVVSGSVHSQSYIHYDASLGWTNISATIDHTQILNRGTYTHSVIDNHIDNTTTAHFGQDLKSTATPTFAQLTIGEPSISTNCATKNYVDNAVQSAGGQHSVISFFDPTSGLPVSPSTGDAYISSATANTWIKDIIYIYNGTAWAETLPQIGLTVYIEGGSVYSQETVIYNGTAWIALGQSINHTDLLNIGTNTHAQIDTHLSNSTTAHFGQNLQITGNPIFNTIKLSSNANATDLATGAVQINGGISVEKNIVTGGNVSVAGTLAITSLTDTTDTASGSLTLRGGMGIRADVSIGGVTHLYNTMDATDITTGSLIVDGGASIQRNLIVGGSVNVSGTTVINNTIDATDVNTGALQVIGGESIQKNLIVGGNVGISGTTNLTNTLTTNNIIVNGQSTLNNTVSVTSTINATSATSGAVVINGGIGVIKDVFVGGNVKILSSANATDNLTGALHVTGGVGVQRDIFVQGLTTTSTELIASTLDAIDALTGALNVVGGVGIQKSLYVGNSVHIRENLIAESTVDSTDTATGAVQIAGGMSMLKNLNVGGNENISGLLTTHSEIITSTSDATDTLTGALQIAGGLVVRKNTRILGTTIVNNEIVTSTVNATDTLTGAVTIGGGMGVGKDVRVGGTINVTGGIQSTDISTGTVVITGGTGLSGNLNVGGTINVAGQSILTTAILTATQDATSVNSGVLNVSGGVGFGKNLYVGGNTVSNTLNILSTTDASDVNTGATIISGGLAVKKSAFIGSRLTSTGLTSTDLKLRNSSNKNTILLPNNSTTSDYNLTMPSSLPSGAMSSLVSDASGNLSWNNQLFVANNVKIVSMTPRQGEFSSIELAINACTNPSSSNPYLIQISAGVYQENQLTVPSYVFIYGMGQESVYIESIGNGDLFHLSNVTAVANVIIQNVSGVAISCVDFGDYIDLTTLYILNCGTGIYAVAQTLESYLYLTDVYVYNSASYDLYLDDSSAILYCSIVNLTLDMTISDGSVKSIFGNKSNVTANSFTCLGNNVDSLGIQLNGGAYLIGNGLSITECTKGIYCPASALTTTIQISSGNLSNNTNDIYISNNNTAGYYFGVVNKTNSVIPTIAPFYLYNTYPTIVNVSNKGGDFSSIAQAVNFITDASDEKQYVVRVYPGTYTEPPFTMKNYVHVQGVGGSPGGTIVKPSTQGAHFVTHASSSTLGFITFSGLLGSADYAHIYCPGSSSDLVTTIISCNFDNVECPFIQDTSVGNSHVLIDNCGITNGTDVYYGTKISSTGSYTAICYLISTYTTLVGTSLVAYRSITGQNTILTLTTGTVVNSQTTGKYIDVSDGATVVFGNINVIGFDTCINVNNSGASPTLNGDLNISGTGAYDINIAHTSAVGFIRCNATPSKIVCATENFPFQISSSNGLTIIGNLYMGKTFATNIDMTNSVKYGTNLGVVSGGNRTIAGLGLTVSSGNGYIVSGTIPNDTLHYITWVEQLINLPANSNNYVYIDSSGIVQYSSAHPSSSLSNIILFYVSTNSTDVLYIQDIMNNVNYTGSILENTMKHAYGPRVASGLLTTQNATPLHLDISAGEYFYGNNHYVASASSNVTLNTYYRDGSSGWTIGSSNAVTGQWDNNSGTLQTMANNTHVKHSIYMNTDETGTSTYFLVFAQTTFDALASAIVGLFPQQPSTFITSMVLIAGVVVSKDNSGNISIGTITDARPMVSQKTIGFSATADHNSLSNLAVGDVHPQYVRTDGTRVMTSNLQMGGNNITGLGTVSSNDTIPDTMNTFAHASRHALNGNDPLSVGIPVSIGATNSAGSANTFVRSDHVHAHDNQLGGTLHSAVTQAVNGFMIASDKLKLDNATASSTASTLVIRDASGNFSTNALTLTSTTLSTDVQTGSLIVGGGVGIAKCLNVGTKINVYSTENATDILTGAVKIAGGISVTKDAYINNNLTALTEVILSTMNATDILTGAVNIRGGVGIQKDLHVGGNEIITGSLTTTTENITSTIDTTSVDTGALTINGGMGITKNINVGGSMTIYSTLDSTDISSGALNVYGGVSLAKTLYVGTKAFVYDTTTLNDVIITSTIDSSSVVNGALNVAGGIGIGKNANIGGQLSTQTELILATSDATSATTGSLVITGGVGIQKNLNVNSRVTSNGMTSSDVILKNNSNNTTTVVPNATISQNYTLTMPSGLPSGTISALVSDASGNLTWNNQLFTSNQVKVVSKTPKPGEFSTIESAIASITDSSQSKPYFVYVEAGTYSENEITLPTYVTIAGCSHESVFVTTNGSHDLFNLANNTYVTQMTVHNIAGTAINVIDAGVPTTIENISIVACDIGIYIRSDSQVSRVLMTSIYVQECTTLGILIDDSTFRTNVALNNITVLTTSVQAPVGISIRSNAYAISSNLQFIGTLTTSGLVALEVQGGAVCVIEILAVYFYTTGLSMPTSVLASSVNISSGNLSNVTTGINIANTNASGYYFGVINRITSVIPDACAFYIYGTYPTLIAVSNKGGDYASVATAVNAITDASVDKQYIIRVYPGIYNEPPFATKDYVHIQGIGAPQGTVLTPTTQNTHFITHASNSILLNITTVGQLGSINYAHIYCPGSATNKQSTINACMFGDVQVPIIQDTSAGSSNVIVNNATVLVGTDISYGIRVSAVSPNTAVCYLTNNYSNFSGSNLISLRTITGSTAKMIATNGTFINNSHIGKFATLSDGATLVVSSVTLTGFDTAIYVPNVGSGPVISGDIIINESQTYDINILNANTTGALRGSFEYEKINSVSNNINLQFADDQGYNIVGDIYIGDTLANVTKLTPSIHYSTNLGIVSGGEHTQTGLDVTVNAGTGYLYIGTIPTDTIKYIEWTQQTVTLAQNALNYIYIDNTGTLNSATSKPDQQLTIIICDAYTDATTILFVQNIDLKSNYTGTMTENTMRSALGPIVSNGLIATASATTLSIDISSGSYFYGTNQYSNNSETAITFYTFYRNGSSGWTRGSSSTVTAQYDNNSGTLQTVPTSSYVKHALYLNTDSNGVVTYFLVFGQETFTTIATARTGNLPIVPTFFVETIVSIGGVIVQNALMGGATLSEIIDIRPTVAFRAGGTTATSDHNSLANLTVGDAHTQYFRTDGTRTLGGSLKLGGNVIAGLSTGNSISDNTSPTPNTINIFTHASRHALNGSDPLSVGTPVSIGTVNSDGVANTFVRSDHVHAHDNQLGGALHSAVTQAVNGFMTATDKLKLDNATASSTASTLVIRDASGNFSTNAITIVSTTNSTDTLTGSVVISGGTGIAKNLNVGGSLSIAGNETLTGILTCNATTNSTSITNGSVVIAGGVGIAENLNVGGNLDVTGFTTSNTIQIVSTINSTDALTGSIQTSGGLGVVKDAYVGGNLFALTATLNSTIDAIDVNSGAIKTSGGMGIAKDVYIGGNTNILATTLSNDYTSGSLVVGGGVGIASDANIGGNLYVTGIFEAQSASYKTLILTGTTESTSVNSGAFKLAGGAGIAKNLNVGGNEVLTGTLIVQNTTNSISTATGAVQILGGIGIVGNENISGVLTVLNATGSTSTSTGAVQISGGVGIGDSINIGGNEILTGILTVNNTTLSTSVTTGAVVISGGVGIGDSVNMNGTITAYNTIDSSAINTGAFILLGGMSIAKNVNVGGTETINGTVTVNNTTDASDINSGSVKSLGGMGIAKNVYVGGNQDIAGTLTIHNTTLSTSITTGSVVISGGVGIGDSINIAGSETLNGVLIITDATESTSVDTGAVILSGGLGATGNLNVGGNTTLAGTFTNSNTTESTSANTGAFILSGGLGVAKNINVDGNATLAGTLINSNATESTSTNTGAFILSGGIGVAKNANVGGNLNVILNETLSGTLSVLNNTDTTLTNAGSIVTSGGIGIAKNINIGGNEVLTGSLTVNSLTDANATNNGSVIISGGMGLAKNIYVGGNEVLTGSMTVNNLTDANATNAGSVVVAGGIGIAKNIYVGGNEVLTGTLTLNNTTDSTAITNGSLIVGGGIGIAKNINVGGSGVMTGTLTINNTTDAGTTNTGSVIIAGGMGIAKNIFVGGNENLTGILTVTNNTESSVTNNGSVIISGGMGIAKNINIGGNENLTGILTVTDNNDAVATNSGAVVVAGGVGIAKNIYVGGNEFLTGTMAISNNGDSNATNNGALTVAGGVGIGKSVYVGGSETITGALTINNTVNTTVTNSGSVLIAGGVGIAKNVIVGGNEILTGILTINNTTDSNAVNSGSLVTYGGMGITKSTSIGGILSVMNTSDSLSTNSGAVIVSGGVGIANTLNVGGNENLTGILNILDTINSNATNNGSLVVAGGVGIANNLNVGGDENINGTLGVTGIATLNNATDSSATNLGSLVVVGGAGIAKNLYVGGNEVLTGTFGVAGIATLNNTIDSNATNTGSLVVVGGVGIAKNLNVGGNENISGTLGVTGIATLNNATDSDATNTGSLVVVGGAGIAKNLYVGGNEVLTGTLGVTGIATLNNATDSNATNNGSLVVVGGAGIAKNLNVGGTTIVYITTNSSDATTGALQIRGGIGVSSDITCLNERIFGTLYTDVINKQLSTGTGITIDSSSILYVDNTSDAVSINNGAIQVNGGGSISKNLYVGGNENLTGTFTCTNVSDTTSSNSGSVILAGGMGVAKALYIGSTNGTTSTTTGALVVMGGVSINGTDVSTDANSGSLVIKGGLGVAGVVNGGKYIPVLQRQGGSATVWNTNGTTNYTIQGTTKCYTGASLIASFAYSASAGNSTTLVVTFPAAFTNIPIVLITNAGSSAGVSPAFGVAVTAVTVSTFTVTSCKISTGNTTATVKFHWMAWGI